ncbi:MAG: hypothetical protein C0501_26520 [Isosphaera sp.]|nr:hypothetical protein [Isosphaera sp.]
MDIPPLPKYPLPTPPEPAGGDIDWRLPALRLALGALVFGFLALAVFRLCLLVAVCHFLRLLGCCD